MKRLLALSVCIAVATFAATLPGCGARTTYANGYGDDVVDAAAASAERQGKLLIIDASASWCGPCKQMDAKTWTDQAVIQWILDNAVFVQFDVDESPMTSRTLGIKAMPTVIAIRDGKEIDRVRGFRGPREIIDWFESVK